MSEATNVSGPDSARAAQDSKGHRNTIQRLIPPSPNHGYSDRRVIPPSAPQGHDAHRVIPTEGSRQADKPEESQNEVQDRNPHAEENVSKFRQAWHRFKRGERLAQEDLKVQQPLPDGRHAFGSTRGDNELGVIQPGTDPKTLVPEGKTWEDLTDAERGRLEYRGKIGNYFPHKPLEEAKQPEPSEQATDALPKPNFGQFDNSSYGEEGGPDRLKMSEEAQMRRRLAREGGAMPPSADIGEAEPEAPPASTEQPLVKGDPWVSERGWNEADVRLPGQVTAESLIPQMIPKGKTWEGLTDAERKSIEDRARYRASRGDFVFAQPRDGEKPATEVPEPPIKPTLEEEAPNVPQAEGERLASRERETSEVEQAYKDVSGMMHDSLATSFARQMILERRAAGESIDINNEEVMRPIMSQAEEALGRFGAQHTVATLRGKLVQSLGLSDEDTARLQGMNPHSKEYSELLENGVNKAAGERRTRANETTDSKERTRLRRQATQLEKQLGSLREQSLTETDRVIADGLSIHEQRTLYMYGDLMRFVDKKGNILKSKARVLPDGTKIMDKPTVDAHIDFLADRKFQLEKSIREEGRDLAPDEAEQLAEYIRLQDMLVQHSTKYRVEKGRAGEEYVTVHGKRVDGEALLTSEAEHLRISGLFESRPEGVAEDLLRDRLELRIPSKAKSKSPPGGPPEPPGPEEPGITPPKDSETPRARLVRRVLAGPVGKWVRAAVFTAAVAGGLLPIRDVLAPAGQSGADTSEGNKIERVVEEEHDAGTPVAAPTEASNPTEPPAAEPTETVDLAPTPESTEEPPPDPTAEPTVEPTEPPATATATPGEDGGGDSIRPRPSPRTGGEEEPGGENTLREEVDVFMDDAEMVKINGQGDYISLEADGKQIMDGETFNKEVYTNPHDLAGFVLLNYDQYKSAWEAAGYPPDEIPTPEQIREWEKNDDLDNLQKWADIQQDGDVYIVFDNKNENGKPEDEYTEAADAATTAVDNGTFGEFSAEVNRRKQEMIDKLNDPGRIANAAYSQVIAEGKDALSQEQAKVQDDGVVV